MRKHIIWTYEKELLQNYLNNSKSYVDFFEKLDLKVSKSLIKMLQYRIKVENINRNMFLENVKKQTFFKSKDLSEILVENSSYLSSGGLKSRLIKNNFLEYKCAICNINEWNNKQLVLQLDHINGKSNDNRIENLRLLCPNCHSQTDTYAGKKKKPPKISTRLKVCGICKTEVQNKVFCDECDRKNKLKMRRVERPSYEELNNSVKLIGYSATGRKYGVSDNSIRKWLKSYEL